MKTLTPHHSRAQRKTKKLLKELKEKIDKDNFRKHYLHMLPYRSQHSTYLT